MNLNDLTDPRSFHQYMLTVNARLQGEYVPIPARPFRAWQVLQEDIGARLMWLRSPEAERIAHWFTSQYGTRAGHGVWHRRLLAQLGGDPWVLNVPMVYGRVRLDLLQMIEHGSAALLRRITQEELGVSIPYFPKQWTRSTLSIIPNQNCILIGLAPSSTRRTASRTSGCHVGHRSKPSRRS